MKTYKVRNELASGSLTRNMVAEGPEGPVVLRVLHPYIAEDQIIRRVYLDYARELVSIVHPNLVRSYDIDESDGGVALIQEYCDGPSSMSARAGSIDELLRWSSGVADALAWLHESGRVHRAIRPGNVHLTSAGVAKLGDFREAPARHLLGLSSTTTMVAEPQFSPPEVFHGEGWDSRGDVYALAVIMYYWAVGQLPLGVAEAVAGVAAASVMDNPRDLRSEIPPWFGELLVRCLGPRDLRPDSRDVAQSLREHSEPPGEELEECLHCFALVPVDVDGCSHCGNPLPELRNDGDTSLVIRRLGETESAVAPLIRRLRILSGDPDYSLKLITGDKRMYSKAEQKENQSLPCRIADQLSRESAELLAQVLGQGDGIKVTVHPSDVAIRRYKRGPVITIQPRRRRGAAGGLRELLSVDLPEGRYTGLARLFLRELSRCLADHPVIDPETFKAFVEKFTTYHGELESLATLVGFSSLQGKYWKGSRGSDDDADEVYRALTDGQRELERRVTVLERSKAALQQIHRGEREPGDLVQVLRDLLDSTLPSNPGDREVATRGLE